MKGGNLLPKKVIKDTVLENAKKQLGKEIAKCRGKTRSQRNLANAIGLPPSNMKYIEDGVNAPSGEVYLKIIAELKPLSRQLKKMDKLYAAIRKTPPPDVCQIINSNQELFETVRLLGGLILNEEQLKKTEMLFKSFINDNEKGEIENDG